MYLQGTVPLESWAIVSRNKIIHPPETAAQTSNTYSEIVPKQLHDQGAVFVRLFIQCIQFSNCFIKCLKQRAFSKAVTGSLELV